MVGAADATPVAADFDGDGLADPALHKAEGKFDAWLSGNGHRLSGPWSFPSALNSWECG